MTQNNYSYTNLSDGRSLYGSGGSRGGGGGNGNRPTQKQIAYYMDLCAQRNIAPANIAKLTYDELRVIVEELRKTYPASEKQISMIREMCERMNIVCPSDADLTKLTGGREGTASKMIAALMEQERSMADSLPPTENQLQYIVSMFLCPDVEFDEVGIHSKRIYLDMAVDDMQLWRLMSGQEVADHLVANIKRTDASTFIEKFRDVYAQWKQSRITIEQMRYIRELEQRMCDLSTKSATEGAVNIDGETVEILTTTKREWNPQGYTPLTEEQLMMFSKEESGALIDQMRIELTRREYGQDNTHTEDDIESARSASNRYKLSTQEYVKLNDILHALCAVTGQDDVELINSGFYLFNHKGETQDGGEDVRRKRKYIREYMMYAIQENFITMTGLLSMCDRCDTALEILLGVEMPAKYVDRESVIETRNTADRDKFKFGSGAMPTYEECK